MNLAVLSVAVISKDSDLLREITWCLSAYGYLVQSHREAHALVTTWQAAQPDFLIVDSDHPDFPTISRLSHLGNDCFTFKILLHDMSQPLDRVAEEEASFNDVISKPLNCGEALARLRAGAQFLEFERRMREQAFCDNCTGLLSRSGLLKTLEFSDPPPDADESQNLALVLISVDFLESLTKRFGVQARDEILRGVATIAADSADERAWVARIRPNVFALVFTNSSISHCESVAEDIRRRVAEREFFVSGHSLHLTATFCATLFDSSTVLTDAALLEAEKNLRYARTLGGSTVSRCGQFDSDYKDWVEQNIKSGDAMSKLTARDVMAPFTAAVHEARLDDAELAPVRASNAALAPYLSADGAYRGILHRDAFQEADGSQLGARLETPGEIAENTPYTELMERFTVRDEQVLIVLRDRHPLGYVTSESMAKLLEPVD